MENDEMTGSECEHSRSISYAIDQSSEACNALQRVVEDARRSKNPEAVEVFTQTKLIYQRAVVDLVKARGEHQASCPECQGLGA